MRVSLQWLKELVPFQSEPSALAEKLSMAGFEVDSDEDLSARARGVVVGRVSSKIAHPDATKLNVCAVDIGGSSPLQIVCGASNVQEGMAVAVATVGSFLPAVQLTIKPASLRGVESSGMLCSLAELGLENKVDGLVDLDQVAKELKQELPGLGLPVASLLGLNDRIFELAVTANRADGLSMLGIAREVAALEQLEVKLPLISCGPTALELKGKDLLKHSELFSLTEIVNVQVTDSPLWLQRRLEAAGQRPVNNVVDITNLVMLETGQPLHAYDRESLKCDDPHAFGLRFAKKGESVLCLDGVERELNENNLLVTNQENPVALAGVIGSQASAVQSHTKNIYLEAAIFPATSIRKSSRAAGIRSEASARFERGVAKENCVAAANRAVDLLLQLTGATIGNRWLIETDQTATEPIELRRLALERLLGPLDNGEAGYGEIESQEVVNILERLGCSVNSEGEQQSEDEIWHVNVPPSRSGDLKREVDLIEEVARLVGYDRFCSHLPDPVEPGGLSAKEQLLRRLCFALRGAGLQELMHLSLVSKDLNAEINNKDQIALSNPLLSDYGHLRTNLRDGLINAASRNLQAPQPGFWGFEVGKIFSLNKSDYFEQERLTGIICGCNKSELWTTSGKQKLVDYYEARGILAKALSEIGVSLQDIPFAQDPQLHPGRSVQLFLEGKAIGVFGEIHPSLAENNDLGVGSTIFDMELEPILSAASRANKLTPIFKNYPTVPASERDLAFVVKETTQVNSVLNAIGKAAGPLLENVQLLDRYKGAPVETGYCSLNVRLRFRSEDTTLRDEQVEPLMKTVREMLLEKFNAQLRV